MTTLLILLIVAGAVAVCVGTVLLLKNTSDKDPVKKPEKKPDDCRRTYGMISDFREEEIPDPKTGGTKTAYRPVVEYEVDGVRYTYTEAPLRSSRRGLGRQYTIIFDRKNPAEVIRRPNEISFLIVAVGTLAVIAGVILLITGME